MVNEARLLLDGVMEDLDVNRTVLVTVGITAYVVIALLVLYALCQTTGWTRQFAEKVD